MFALASRLLPSPPLPDCAFRLSGRCFTFLGPPRTKQEQCSKVSPEQIDLGFNRVELPTLQLDKGHQSVPLLGLLSEGRFPRPKRSVTPASIELLRDHDNAVIQAFVLSFWVMASQIMFFFFFCIWDFSCFFCPLPCQAGHANRDYVFPHFLYICVKLLPFRVCPIQQRQTAYPLQTQQKTYQAGPNGKAGIYASKDCTPPPCPRSTPCSHPDLIDLTRTWVLQAEPEHTISRSQGPPSTLTPPQSNLPKSGVLPKGQRKKQNTLEAASTKGCAEFSFVDAGLQLGFST